MIRGVIQSSSAISQRLIIATLLPAVFIGLLNTGYQVLEALRATRAEIVPGWRGAVQATLGADPGFAPSVFFDAVVVGALYLLPVFLTALISGYFWQALFAHYRQQEEGGLVISALIFTLLLPPPIPLWQVSLGMSFGAVFGKEIFGGWGRNIAHPSLLAFAFVSLSFPDPGAGQAFWAGLGDFAGTPLIAQIGIEGAGALERLQQSWLMTFAGIAPGPLGSGSALAAILGGVFLIFLRLASWRLIAGSVASLVIVSLIFQTSADVTGDAVRALPFYWHLVLGSFLFGVMFIATDPSTSAMTNAGRWVQGLLIGSLVICVRIFNPDHADGTILVLLLASLAAPLIDYFVVLANIRRREKRNAS